MGEELHVFDVSLCDYAIGNITQFWADQRFARWIIDALAPSEVLEYVIAREDEFIHPPVARSLLNKDEFFYLASALDDPPPGGPWEWLSWPQLHRRYIQTLTDVRQGLTRTTCEEWAADCARFAMQLDSDGLSLRDGIVTVGEWVSVIRNLQRAMGHLMCVPRPVGLAPTPSTAAVPITATNIDPRFQGLTDEQAVSIQRMEAAIQAHPAGVKAKAGRLIKDAHISRLAGWRALRWLAGRGEYHGFRSDYAPAAAP